MSFLRRVILKMWKSKLLNPSVYWLSMVASIPSASNVEIRNYLLLLNTMFGIWPWQTLNNLRGRGVHTLCHSTLCAHSTVEKFLRVKACSVVGSERKRVLQLSSLLSHLWTNLLLLVLNRIDNLKASYH